MAVDFQDKFFADTSPSYVFNSRFTTVGTRLAVSSYAPFPLLTKKLENDNMVVKRGDNMFSTIRYVFFLVLFIGLFVGYLLKRKSNQSITVKKLVLFIVAFVLVTTVSNLIPVENAFITFSSPEEAYNYFDSADVEIVVEGEKSALIIADGNIHKIVPKSAGGWKIGMGLDSKKEKEKIYNGYWIFVFNYKKTDEKYIMVSSSDKKIIDITDSVGSVFYNSDDSRYSYAYIKDYDNTYTVNVNGEGILLN